MHNRRLDFITFDFLILALRIIKFESHRMYKLLMLTSRQETLQLFYAILIS